MFTIYTYVVFPLSEKPNKLYRKNNARTRAKSKKEPRKLSGSTNIPFTNPSFSPLYMELLPAAFAAFPESDETIRVVVTGDLPSIEGAVKRLRR